MSSSSFEALERVSTKRDEWAELPLSEKLEILKELDTLFHGPTVGYEKIFQHAGKGALDIMGFPSDTDEGTMQAKEQAMLTVTVYKTTLNSLLQVYEHRVKVMNHKDAHPTLPETFKTRTAINGQVCVQAFPTLPISKQGLASGCTGEIWLAKETVPSEDKVQAYQYPEVDEKTSGLMIVVGAGNHGSLALIDSLYGLFTRNCVCYLKLHALRNYMDPLIRLLLAPLIKRGYMDLECHTTNKRAAALVHHPLVTAVHLTGGKATHDAIVWGSDPSEQQKNKQSNTPVLKAEMTSELGAVSPWIVVPAKYTSAELKDQAGMLATTIHANASCNCNAPKMVVVSESWEQKNEFLKILKTRLAENILPVPYYPGAAERWEAFRAHYPQAELLDSTTGLGVEERHLSKPLLSNKKEATLLPHLIIDLSIDLTTEEGQKSVQQEYAMNNEPFCPVFTIARVQHTETLDAFCDTAAKFCNEYLFGSLSGTVTVKPELQSTDAFQHLIANLKYGSIGVNTWGGICFACPEGAWGAFPGEPLNNVESGIGRINNVLGLAGFEKFVLTSSIVSMLHPQLETNLKKQGNIWQAVSKFFIAPGVGPVMELMWALTGIDLANASSIVGGATLVAAVGYLFTRRGSSAA